MELATEVVMPALGMAQETGKLVSWLKREGEAVTKGEPIMEIETDKATVEIEAPASGVLSDVRAWEGDEVPVGQPVAVILGPGETQTPRSNPKASAVVDASPVARRMAQEHGLDLSQVKPDGGQVKKEDVLAYLEGATHAGQAPAQPPIPTRGVNPQQNQVPGKVRASPKARRLAVEQSLDLSAVRGSGPQGAVLAADMLKAAAAPQAGPARVEEPPGVEKPGTVWRIMADRMAESWSSAPHFYLVREVRADALAEMRRGVTPAVEKRVGVQPTYTDLLLKMIAVTLRSHPHLNASWAGEGLQFHKDIHVGMAVGIEDGLVVPVIHHTDTLSLGEIAARRTQLVEQANAHRLRQADISDGTFTFTNLGMYGVDAFMAVLNPPQAAILAAGSIADRVVAENGQAVVRPTLILTLSCDHRVVDGVRAAQFLDDLAKLIEDPWGLLA